MRVQRLLVRIYTSWMSRWVPVVALSAIVSIVASGCKGNDDDEDAREHRKHRVAAGGAGSTSGGGVSLSCPFGLCGGGSSESGPAHVCERMNEMMTTETGKHAPIDDKALAQCVAQLEKMQRDTPKEYGKMERCADTATDMKSLIACMTAMYLDGGVP